MAPEGNRAAGVHHDDPGGLGVRRRARRACRGTEGRRRVGRRELARGRVRRPVRLRRQLRRASRHSTRRPTPRAARASYGIQSRLQVRALVVEGADGKRIALVKNDLYIPQDLLWRRTAQLLEAGDSGIARANLTMASTHNHSSPYYSSTVVGRVGVPGRLRRPLLRLLRRRAWPRRWSSAARDARAGARGRVGDASFDKTPPPLVRPGDRRRRHARPAIPNSRHRPRPDRGPLRRHLATPGSPSRSPTSSTSRSTPSSSTATT